MGKSGDFWEGISDPKSGIKPCVTTSKHWEIRAFMGLAVKS